MKPVLVLFACSCLLARPAPAQPAPLPAAALREAATPEAATPESAGLDAGMARARDLAAEVDELKHKLAVIGEELESARTGSAPVTPSLETARATGVGPAASKVYVRDGLSVGGYGELLFSYYRDRLQNGTASPVDALADTQRAVVYIGYKFNDWVVLNTELEFEHSGFSDKHAKGEAIVEFAYLDFLVRPWLNVRAGQVLLPVGFLNELHEPPVFLGALRPRLEQSTGLIPTTWHELGVGLYGDLPGEITYRLYVVNGLDAARFNAKGIGGIGGGRQDGHLAIANKPAVTGRLDWHPLSGALLGGSFYVGDSAQRLGWQPIWTTLVEAHAEYRGSGLQARAVYAHVTVDRAGMTALASGSSAPVESFGTGTVQNGTYVEAGYDVLTWVPSARQSLIPFARFEWMDTQHEVAPGARRDPANRRTIVEVGLNYKPITQVAVKLDYDFVFDAAGTGRNQLNLALGYLF